MTTLRSERTRLLAVAVMVAVAGVGGAVALSPGIGALDLPVKASLAFAFALVAGILTYRRPVVFPFAAFLFMVPFDNLLQTGSGTVTKFLGVASAVVTLLVLVDRRRAIGPPVAVIAWAVFLVWNVASFMWSENPWFRPDFLVLTAQLFALFVVYAMLRVRVAELRALLVAVVAGGCACAGYGVWLYTHGTAISKSAASDRLAIVLGTGASGPFINADHFSAALVFPVALVLVAALHLRGWQKVLSAAALLLLMAGIYVSGTRGSLIAVGVMVLYLLVVYRHRVQLLGVATLALLASVPLPNTWLRFFDPSQGDAGGRYGIWAIAWDAFRRHWLLGIGTGQFRLAYEESYLNVPVFFNGHRWQEDAHNLIASTAVELGIVGLALVLLAWYLQFRVVRSIPRTSGLFDVRIAIEAGTLGLFVNALSVDLMFYKYLWIAFTLGALVRNAWLADGVSARLPAAQPSEPPPKPGYIPVRVFASSPS